VYINAFGYLALSLPLLVLWLVVVLFFDRQMYMIFAPGSCGSARRSAAVR
jgi:hypothetical protein